MTWLIVVIFATVQGDVYIFEKPRFDNQLECEQSIRNPNDVLRYVEKLYVEYGKHMPIYSVGCLTEEKIDEILSKQEGQV